MSSSARATVCLALITAAVVWSPGAAGAQEPTFEIAFQSDRDGKDGELWLVDSTGAKEQALTENATPDAAPSWSPDGNTIVYACAPEDNWELCTIDPATREVTQLTRTAVDEFDPRYTPDGTQIVLETYPHAGKADIAIMPAKGGVPKPLMSTPTRDEQDPVPEPGSSRIAFASDGNIAVLDTTAPRKVTLVTRSSLRDTDPSFSSRDEIAFARPRRGRLDIVVAGAVGESGSRPLSALTSDVPDDIHPAWTADATEIVFARARRTRRGFRIFSMSADGRGRRAVTKGGAYDDTAPAPRPPGGVPLAARTLRAPRSPAGAGPLGQPLRVDALLATAATHCTGYNLITGTSGNNTRNGTSGRDCIYGYGGNDTLTGNGGRDKLYGGDNNDTLWATDGEQDFANGGKGADLAHIDNGLDTYTGTAVD